MITARKVSLASSDCSGTKYQFNRVKASLRVISSHAFMMHEEDVMTWNCIHAKGINPSKHPYTSFNSQSCSWRRISCRTVGLQCIILHNVQNDNQTCKLLISVLVMRH